MKIARLLALSFILAVGWVTAQTVYVVPEGTPGVFPVNPYATWQTAATNLLDAQQAFVDDSNCTHMLVAPGTYYLTNTFSLTSRDIHLRSYDANNPDVLPVESTILDGSYPDYTNRIFYLDGGTCIVEGFTLRNGYPSGEGTTTGSGGGFFVTNGVDITIRYCNFISNSAYNMGGAIYVGNGIFIHGCNFIDNQAVFSHAGAVGAYGKSVISNCSFVGNTAAGFGGAGYLAGADSFITHCRIISNTAGGSGGGVYLDETVSTRNCLIAHNTSSNDGGGINFGSANQGGIIESCTIVSNYAVANGGGVAFGNTNTGTCYNNIIYYNDAGSSLNCHQPERCTWSNNCSTPTVGGIDNITAEPQFVNFDAGNYRLASLSPCVDSGINRDWMTEGFDLDAGVRIRYGAVDMGCYEFPLPEVVVTPLTQTNSTIVGEHTSGVFAISAYGLIANYPGESFDWVARTTNFWISLGATSGVVTAGGAGASTVWTNSAAMLAPGRYVGAPLFWATNASSVLESAPPAPAAPEMTLEVTGLRVGPAVISNSSMMNFNAPSQEISVWNEGPGELAWTAAAQGAATNWLSVNPASGVSTGWTVGVTNTVSLEFHTADLTLGEYFGQVSVQPDLGGAARTVEVRLRVEEPGGLTVGPSTFEWDVMRGRPLSPAGLMITNISGLYNSHYGVLVTTGTSWLNVSGATNGVLVPGGVAQVTVSGSASNLAVGQHTGNIRITNAVVDVTTSNVSVGTPYDIPVLLRVNPRPVLSVSVGSITNVAVEGEDAPAKIFQVWNGSGFYTLTYQVSDNVPWVILSSAGGTSAGKHDVISLDYSTAGLVAGSYTGKVTVTASDPVEGTNRQEIALLLEVTGMAGLGCDGVEKTYELRLSDPAATGGFNVWNTSTSAGTALRWDAAVIVAASADRGSAVGAIHPSSFILHPFLSVSPAGGTLAAGGMQSVTLACNPAGLAPGQYSALVRVSGTDTLTRKPARNSPFDILVKLRVQAGDSLNFGRGRSAMIVYGTENGYWGLRDLAGDFYWDWFGAYGYAPAPGDYDGDGVAELSVYRGKSGSWYWKKLGSGAIQMLGNWGGPAFEPVRGDFDGDGKHDFVLYNEQAGTWYALLSASGYQSVGAVFGGPGLRPVRGDFDGDGKADPALYDEAGGMWYALLSSQNYRFVGGAFGGPGYHGFGGDYDGDGRTDLCLYDSAGRWYVITAESRGLIWGESWGGPGWQALAGDYDGDGIDDLAIYNAGTGNWRIRRRDGTVLAWDVPWGGYGYQPVGR